MNNLFSRNIRQILERRASEKKTFLYFEDKTISYCLLEKNVNKVANLLHDLGVRKKDKVALMMPNHPDFIYSWLGATKLGGIIVPINIHLKGRMLQYALDHSDAKIMIMASRYRDRYSVVKDQIPKIKTEIWWKEGKIERNEDLGLTFNRAYSMPNHRPPTVDIYENDLMSIMYTSGTTGISKAVMLYHKSYHAMALAIMNLVDLREDDILFVWDPLFHISGQEIVMATLLSGARMVLTRTFSASRFWDQVRRYNATIIHYLGGVLNYLYRQPEKVSDSDNPVRIAFGGGHHLSYGESLRKDLTWKSGKTMD